VSASQPLRREPRRSDDVAPGFALYVEGPRDREILRAWAWRVRPDLAHAVAQTTVILGGRQPARAALHFRSLRAEALGARGVCVLDRDGDASAAAPPAEPGLEFFTWSRRHIESYLLVPSAILRAAGLAPRDARLRRLVERHLPDPEDEAALRMIHAKSLLGESGALARALGRPLAAGRIARAMDAADLHDDVLRILRRVEAALGGGDEGPDLPPA
jgi:hypothetical protein